MKRKVSEWVVGLRMSRAAKPVEGMAFHGEEVPGTGGTGEVLWLPVKILTVVQGGSGVRPGRGKKIPPSRPEPLPAASGLVLRSVDLRRRTEGTSPPAVISV